jgi:hypothetical protein
MAGAMQVSALVVDGDVMAAAEVWNKRIAEIDYETM